MKKLLPLLILFSVACTRELTCPQGEKVCSGHCVSLLDDPANCGACGNAVGPLEVCVGGSAACAPGIGLCGSTCTDFARDPDNCGACDAACTLDQLCATDIAGPACTSSCPGGLTVCSRACVDLLADTYHCGACGHACPGGQICLAGECRPDLVVACYATTEVLPLTAALARAGDARATPSGPTKIAVHGGSVYSANGYPQASVSVLPFDPATPVHTVAVTGTDLENIDLVGDVVLVSNSAVGSLLFLSLAGDVIGEVAMPDQQTFPNPYGFAVVGTTAYVALTGGDSGSGQAVAKVSLSGLAACSADPLNTPCGALLGQIDLLSVPGAFDAPGRPYPSRVAASGGRLFVTLANLKEATISCGAGCTYTAWAEPAGHGKLAVIDPANSDAVSVVDLGAGCGNPGALAVDGNTLWVACGSWTFPDVAPGALVPVDLSVEPPAAGTPLSLSPTLPGGLAFCAGVGYATDQNSGAVVRFDPAARTVEAPVTVCPLGEWGFAWASDVACGH